jgi:hypothetical protein
VYADNGSYTIEGVGAGILSYSSAGVRGQHRATRVSP